MPTCPVTEGGISRHPTSTALPPRACRAVDVVNAYAKSGQPFLVSLHFNALHWPWEAPGDEAESQRLTNLFNFDGGTQRTYQRMIQQMDLQIGRVLQALDANGVSENTIVVFTSDNGGERYADTWPFTGRKTELLEGGLRIPAVISWPGRVPRGSVSDQVMISMDWLPTLLAAYRRGLYPWAHIAPLKWWSPPRRSLLLFKDIHISNNLRRLMRQGRYTVTFDRDFDAVIAACAGRRANRWHLTWITPRIMRIYAEAFDAGHAHSFEVWNEAGKLVGGGYGLAIGASFSSESQFAQESNASRIGMTVLNWHLAHWGFRFNDGKLIGPLWQAMGFREIPRREYLARLAKAERLPSKIGRWQVETDLATVSHWESPAASGG